MGRVTLTFSQNGAELDPLPKEELKQLSGSELFTLSRYNMLFRDFYLETASEGLVTAKTASEGYFKAKLVLQTSI